MPEVDLFVGTGEYQNIVELIGGEGVAGFSLHQPARTKVRYSDQPTFIHTSATPRKIATPRHAVYVKIAEGCFHGCSFCIIPKIRGKFRSRTIEDIAKEAEALVKNGARELNLIAQDTTSYGVDLKDGTDLSKLLKRLERINGDFWIRVMYAYPTSITDDLIATVASSRKICSYLDIPIQHISDKILKAMHRKETGEEVRVLIRKIRKKMPEVTLRTSLIVGFPGETAKEFDELVEFVKEGLFDHVGVFTYSREEGTKASELSGQVPQGTALRRRARLMKAQALVSKRLNRKWVGQRIRALIDVADAEHDEATARTQGQAPDIDGVTLVKGRACAGEFADVKIIGVKGYDLVGAKG
jgi:ribosomal protein S12 methylthiotransferase